MPDQADHLRHLMHEARAPSHPGAAPRLILVAGAKGGVGTTTIAVNLAVASARQTGRTVLVDGALGRSGVAALCGDAGGATIVEVLSGRRRVEEALRPGPAGVWLLAGTWAADHVSDCDPASQERLIAGLRGLGQVDAIVIDAGGGSHRVVERFWRSVDGVLLVVTPDDAAIMDAYAMLKTIGARHRETPVYAVMNAAARHDDSLDAHARLARACQRFLAIDLSCVANVMNSREVAAAARDGQTCVLRSPVCQATQTVEHLARFCGSLGIRRVGD